MHPWGVAVALTIAVFVGAATIHIVATTANILFLTVIFQRLASSCPLFRASAAIFRHKPSAALVLVLTGDGPGREGQAHRSCQRSKGGVEGEAAGQGAVTAPGLDGCICDC